MLFGSVLFCLICLSQTAPQVWYPFGYQNNAGLSVSCPAVGGYVQVGYCQQTTLGTTTCPTNSVCWGGSVCCALSTSVSGVTTVTTSPVVTVTSTTTGCSALDSFGECFTPDNRCGSFFGFRLECVNGLCCPATAG